MRKGKGVWFLRAGHKSDNALGLDIRPGVEDVLIGLSIIISWRKTVKRIATIICSAMLMATFAMAGTAMAKKTYVNGIDLNFPPYGYVDKTGQPAGFDVESMNWIAEKFGFDVKHQPMDWSGIVPALVSGKIDLIASGMSITDERKKVVNFSIPYKVVKQVMVVKNGVDTPAVDFLTTNKRLGVQRGTTAMGWLEENKDKYNYTLVIYDSSPLAVQDMVMGRVDACPMDDTIAEEVAKAKPVKVIGEFGQPSENYGYAVRKEDKELLGMINKGLEMLMKDPHWKELKKKYDLQ